MKPAISSATPLILASTSRYRAELLRRLAVPFEVMPSGLDETPLAAETPANLAQRLARAKAQAVARLKPDRWVLGSDQVPSFEGRVLDKPGNRETATAQLRACSGKSVVFYTAAALVAGERVLAHLDTTIVRFRALSPDQVRARGEGCPAPTHSKTMGRPFATTGCTGRACPWVESAPPRSQLAVSETQER